MHDTYKVGKSVIGELVRTKNKVEIKPSPEGLDLMKKLCDQAKWFESSSKHCNEFDNMLQSNPYLPSTRIQRDLNGTRISSVYNLVQYYLRAKRSLLSYRALYPNTVPELLDNDDWAFTVEVEDILKISKDNVVFSQNEIKLNASFGVVSRRYAHEKITEDNLSIIDMDHWDGTNNISQQKVINVN